nr:PAAR domain-containing protein [Pseudomonas coronafaciens]
MVTCPRCRGVFPIAEGDPDLIEDGKAIAYHGCRVACGALFQSDKHHDLSFWRGGVGCPGRPARWVWPNRLRPDGWLSG